LVGQVDNLREHLGVRNLGANAEGGILGLCLGAGRQDQLRTASGEFKRSLEAQAAVGAGDEDATSLLRGYVAGGPRLIHSSGHLSTVSVGDKV
jgi:hypothetical protein